MSKSRDLGEFPAAALDIDAAGNLDVTGTVTADGLTVDGGSGNSLVNFTPSGTFSTVVSFANASSAFDVVSYGSGSASADNFRIRDNGASRLNIAGNGDISFYEDTGTTPKFFWDASAESLGIGTSSPGNILKILNSANGDGINVENTNASFSESGLFVNNTASTGGNLLRLRSSGSDKVVVLGNGNVGIGVVPKTWFPSLNTTALQIGDTTSIWSLTNGAGDLRTTLDSNLYTDASGNDKYLNTGPGTRYQQIAGEHRWSSAASGTADSTATVSNRMRIDSSGNVGIGMTPAKILDLQATDNLALRFYNGASFKAGFEVATTAGDMISTSAVNDLSIRSQSDMLFAAGGGVEAMRIDGGSLSLLLGTATSYSNNYRMSLLCGSSGGVIVRMSGTSYTAAVFQSSAAASVGTITVDSTSTAYNTSSDYRLKEDDVPMTGATERVKALRPINFAWKANGSRVDGFFAHELAEVVPAAATGTKDAMMDEEYEVTPAVVDAEGVETEAAVMGTRSVPDYQGIDQSKLVPLLTATIQELIARIEILEAK